MFAPDLFAGKIALVTGSTAGMGARTAEQLARSGADLVILNGRSRESGEAMLAELKGLVPSGRFEFVPADYSRPEEVERLFEHAKARGGVDVFVHTCMAEAGGLRPFMETRREDWEKFVAGLFLS